MSAERWIGAALGTLLVLVAAASCGRQEKFPDRIHGNGRIEGDEVRVAVKIGGRVSQLAVREGERVRRGQLLAELATPELGARLQQAEAGLEAARAALAQAETRVGVLRHHAEKARQDFERMRALEDTGAASVRQVDEAENALKETEGELRIAEARVVEARASQRERQAAADLVRIHLEEGRVTSPIGGVVLLRLVEQGEVIQAGQPLAVLVDPERLFLKVYIAEGEIGRVRPGNPARVKVDAFPGRAFEGVVTEVAERAEFTPRDVHMPDERTRLVYGVKVRLVNADGFLKPGMIGDAELLWREVASREVG